MVSTGTPPPSSAASLGSYYDRLAAWTTLVRPLGYGGGSEALTVHRALADPRAGGRQTRTRVHDLIAERVPQPAEPRGLDAGCGLGGTMLDLARLMGGRYVGLTLSAVQQRSATEAVARRGLSDRVEVCLRSYDSPPAGPFTLVTAIESLAHSPDPARSVTALAGVLEPGGVLAIVDDMPEPSAAGDSDLVRFREGWRTPVLWDRQAYLDAFARAGLALIVDDDLTPAWRPRAPLALASLTALNRVARLVPHAGWRALMASYDGGLALERLYRRGAMRYRFLAARRT